MAIRRPCRATQSASKRAARFESFEPRRLMSAAPPFGGARDVDLAYDPSGTLHVAFYDAAAHNLQYAVRSAAGDWSDASVIDASSADVGAQVSIAVDAAGRPGIAYRDVANADLKYAHLGEGGAWVVQTVDGRRRDDTGVEPSLAFDGSNDPVISYYRPTGGTLRVATVVRGQWRVRNVARVGGADHAASSLAINPDTGAWGIAYERADGTVRYSALSGRRVHTSVVDRLSAAGARPSVAFDSAGHPAFTYYDSTNTDVKLARRNDAGWNVSLVADTDARGAGSTLLVEPETDAVRVVYRDVDGATCVASGTLDAVAFDVQTLTSGAAGADAPEPLVVRDPSSQTLVTVFTGDDAAIASTLPAAGGLSAAAVSTDSVSLTWTDAATTETGYEVQQSDDGGATFATVATLGADATSATLSGLTEARSYVFRVVTSDAAGNRVDSQPLPVTTPPAAASGLSATVRSGGRVALAWQDNSQGESSYRVERRLGTSAGDAAWEQVALLGPDATAYLDATTAAGAAYQYRVVASLGEAFDPAAAEVSVVVPTSAPAPAALTVDTDRARQVELSWPDVAGETGYVIERAPAGSGTFTLVATTRANVTRYADVNLPEGAAYVYRVRSASVVGNSGASTAATAQAAVRLASPSGIAPTPLSATSYALTWHDNSLAETGYQVQWCVDGGKYKTYKTLGANATGVTVKGLVGGSTYRFRVRARAATVASAFATSADVAVAPVAPSDLSAVALGDGGQVDLLWKDSKNAGATGFKIERSADGGDFAEVATVGADVTHFVDAVPARSSDYRYRVRAAGDWGASDYSDVAAETGPDLSPTNVSVTVVSQSKLDIAWADNCPRETAYVVRYSDGVKTVELTRPAGSTRATLGGLTPGADYTVEVVAKLASGAEWKSAAATAVMLVAPTNLSVRVGDADGAHLSSSVTLEWRDTNSGEAGYVIERSEDGGATYAFLDTVGAGATRYTDAALPEDTTYSYRVYAYNVNGVGPTSAVAPNVPATWLYAPSSLTAVAAGPFQIDLAWVDNSGAETHYKIAMSAGDDVYYEIGSVSSTGPTAFAVTQDMFGRPLATGATYSFKVMAVNATNASDWSQPARVTTGM